MQTNPTTNSKGAATMDIRLVALDMDGTLLDSDKKQPPDFMDWVKTHPAIKTVIASGRQYYTLVKDFLPIRDQLIYVAENGGIVFERDNVIYLNEMLKTDIKNCLDLIDRTDGTIPVICGAKSAYMRPSDDSVLREVAMYYSHLQQTPDLQEAALQDTIVKIAVFVERKMAESAIRHFTEIAGHLSAVLSGDSWIDIANRTVNKGVAVAAIQEKYGIAPEESMAFGDYLNDTELLQSCGESYCMANGHPDLKALAKYIADSNDNNGVMKILQQIDG